MGTAEVDLDKDSTSPPSGPAHVTSAAGRVNGTEVGTITALLVTVFTVLYFTTNPHCNDLTKLLTSSRDLPSNNS